MTHKHFGHCPTCDHHGALTKHHIYPKRIYGKEHNSRHYLLCRTCHNELETHIPYTKRSHDFYPAILKQFVEEWCKKAKGEIRANGTVREASDVPALHNTDL